MRQIASVSPRQNDCLARCLSVCTLIPSSLVVPYSAERLLTHMAWYLPKRPFSPALDRDRRLSPRLNTHHNDFHRTSRSSSCTLHKISGQVLARKTPRPLTQLSDIFPPPGPFVSCSAQWPFLARELERQRPLSSIQHSKLVITSTTPPQVLRPATFSG